MEGSVAEVTEGQTQALLDWHQQRRQQGIPTVSVLAGPVGLGRHFWKQWTARRQRTTLELTHPNWSIFLTSWIRKLAEECDLYAAAVARLAAHLGRPVAELQAHLTQLSRRDRDIFLEQHFRSWPSVEVARLCRRLLETKPPDSGPTDPWIADLMAGNTAEDSGPCLLRALHELAPVGRPPALLLIGHTQPAVPDSGYRAAGRFLAQVASHVPALPVALAIPARAAASYRDAPETHWQAILREGIIPVVGLDERKIEQRLQRVLSTDTTSLVGTIRRLAQDGASAELVQLFIEAAQACSPTTSSATSTQAEQARSAAERFLYERLESLPETAGLFLLNARPALRFPSGREMEVDLLCPQLQIAIELDGYYHFQDPQAFRRDRRKDFELQKHGYLVLRFLAEDVVTYLEDILDTILEAIACRRHRKEETAT